MEFLSNPTRLPQIVHFLYMDFVGYSLLNAEGKHLVQLTLIELVQSTREVRRARAQDQLVVRDSGDGMALLFQGDPAAPLRCALELHARLQREGIPLRKRVGAPFRLRMGIHTGPATFLEDVNGQANVSGDGIVVATRVMDCGDAGHILASEMTARALTDTLPWRAFFHDLGTCRVKHGTLVHLYNVHGEDEEGLSFGNEAVPARVYESRLQSRKQAERDEEETKRLERELRKNALRRSAGYLGTAAALSALGYAGVVWGIPNFFSEYLREARALLLHPSATPSPGARPPRNALGSITAPPSETTPSDSFPEEAEATRPAAAPTSPRLTRSGDPSAPATSGNDYPEEVTVPGIEGLSASEARALLTERGLTMREDFDLGALDPDRPPGTVADQRPSEGESVRRGSIVRVGLTSRPLDAPALTRRSGFIVDARPVADYQPGKCALFGPDDEMIHPEPGTYDPDRQEENDFFSYSYSEKEARMKAGRDYSFCMAVGVHRNGGLRLDADGAEKLRRYIQQKPFSRPIILCRGRAAN